LNAVLFFPLILLFLNSILYAVCNVGTCSVTALPQFLLSMCSILALLFFLWFLATSKRVRDMPDAVFLSSACILAAGYNGWMLWHYDLKPFGDFLGMHNTAEQMTHVSFFHNISHSIGSLEGIWRERVMFYAYPLYRIFGPSLACLKVLNVSMIIVAGVILYLILRDSFADVRVAKIAVAMYFLIPLRSFYMNIPSHDFAGLFYLAVFCGLVNLFCRGLRKSSLARLALFSVVLGASMYVASISRTLYIFLLLALLALPLRLALSYLPRLARPVFFARVVKCLVFGVLIPIAICKPALNYTTPASNKFVTPATFFEADASYLSGTFTDLIGFKPYADLMNDEEKHYYGYGRMLSETYYNFVSFARMVLRKNYILYRVGFDLQWSSHWDPSTYEASYNDAFRVVLFSLAVVGMIAMMRRYVPFPFMIVVGFGFFFSVLMHLGEVQARYSYALHLFFTAMAGIGLVAIKDLLDGKACPAAFSRRTICLTLVVLFFLTTATVCVGQNFMQLAFRKSPFIFTDLSKAVVLNTEPLKFTESVKIKECVPFCLRALRGPGYPARIGYAFKADVKPGREYRLVFFVHSSNLATGKIRFSMLADDKPILENEEHDIAKLSIVRSKPFHASTGAPEIKLYMDNALEPQANSKDSICDLEFVILIPVSGKPA
jgi:hypothetical protein